MKALFTLALIAFFSVGCSIEVSTEDLRKPPSKSTPSPIGMKYSGGANQTAGSTVDAEFSIGLKDRNLSGTTVDAELTISGSRPTF